MIFTAIGLALDQLLLFDTKIQGFHGIGNLAEQFKTTFDKGQDFNGYIPAQFSLRLKHLTSPGRNVCHFTRSADPV